MIGEVIFHSKAYRHGGLREPTIIDEFLNVVMPVMTVALGVLYTKIRADYKNGTSITFSGYMKAISFKSIETVLRF